MTGRNSGPVPRSVQDTIIRQVVSQIPRGKVATYGEIARLSGLLGQARLVGYALHRLPAKSRIPWQRVINSQGRISLPREGGHYQRQQRLLEKEGVRFERGRIDLERYGWIRSMKFPRAKRR